MSKLESYETTDHLDQLKQLQELKKIKARILENSANTQKPIPKDKPIIFQANPGPQTKFLASTANEILYGGSAGGGKSLALVVYPLRWVQHSDFRALILRRKAVDLPYLVDKSKELYPKIFQGSIFNIQTKTWRFASGASIRFSHCENESDAQSYEGQEYQFIGFDELTHFTESQYLAIKARLRSTNPKLPRYIRATTNPGGVGHEWVFARWNPWLNPDYPKDLLPRKFVSLPVVPSNEILWNIKEHPKNNSKLEWSDVPVDDALSRTFIRASIADNPKLTQNDPNYILQIRDLDPVRRAQLELGDWLIKSGSGLYFKRQNLEIIDGFSQFIHASVRYWDRASTEGKGDWTVGCKAVRLLSGNTIITDIKRDRLSPGNVQNLIKTTCESDDPSTVCWLEQDPGQAGVFEIDFYLNFLSGFPVKSLRKTQDKVTFASPFSSHVEAQKVKILRAPWNTEFINELERFPEGKHDDQVDAASGAFYALNQTPTNKYKPAIIKQKPGEIYG